MNGPLIPWLFLTQSTSFQPFTLWSFVATIGNINFCSHTNTLSILSFSKSQAARLSHQLQLLVNRFCWGFFLQTVEECWADLLVRTQSVKWQWEDRSAEVRLADTLGWLLLCSGEFHPTEFPPGPEPPTHWPAPTKTSEGYETSRHGPQRNK